MSIRWIAHVWERSPYRGERLLLHLALADFANDEGTCFPSQRTLAHKARCSENFVRLAITQMVNDGFVETARGNNGRGNTIIYRLTKPQPANGDLANGDSRTTETPFPTTSTLLMNRNEPSDDWFDRFWVAYPRKVGKAAARKAFGKARRSSEFPTIDNLIAAVERYKASISDMKYCAHPTTWLTQGRWLDDLPQESTSRATIKDDRPQRVKDAESMGAAYWFAGRTEQQLFDETQHLEPDARNAAIAFYRSKGNRK